eukprot:TRINITY_DN38705_c0_g1_i1.p1 TRINITY_DN38705_c0_g1~~TRINITY_DN38705_c0_g1_i1.p1  ORF type:complete len:645 (+),score=142.97 TRINITY_DN38705_c0_g1_i1:44-1978(+)
MTAEQNALAKIADDIARAAADEATGVLSGNESIRIVSRFLEDVEQPHLVQVAIILLQRFKATLAAGEEARVSALQPLTAAVEQVGLPALRRLTKVMESRHAFRAASSLAPLLNRCVVAAVQCCAFVIHDVSDATSVLALAELFDLTFQTLAEAVLDRIERVRPIDSSRLSKAFLLFSTQQDRLAAALAEAREGRRERSRQVVLAPAPAKPSHTWRNDELRQFWTENCAPIYEDGVPVEDLALMLLQAAEAEETPRSREAVMARLVNSENKRKDNASVTAAELDRLGPDIRRFGGLRAWVRALLLPGGPSLAGPGPFGTSGCVIAPPALASTLGSCSSRLGSPAAWASTTATTMWPQSARTTSSSFAPRADGRPPLAFAYSQKRRPPPPPLSARDGEAARSGSDCPVFDAVGRGLLRASQRLVLGEQHGVNARHSVWQDSALHAAATRDAKHAPLTTLLLDKGADANAEDKHLATPLHFAASAGHREAARTLICRGGAEVSRRDRWQNTPLHRAAENGQANVAKLLLEHGAGGDAKDAWGATPLHRAVGRGQRSVVEALLGSGCADLEAEDRSGLRPLHIAAQRGDYALARLLLESGASATARCGLAGRTAEQSARARGHADVATLLQNHAEWITPQTRSLVKAG